MTQPKLRRRTRSTKSPSFAADHALSATERAAFIFSRSFLERVFIFGPLPLWAYLRRRGRAGRGRPERKRGPLFSAKNRGT